MGDGKQARELRLAAALRENLKRRKAAASAVVDTGVEAEPDAAAAPETSGHGVATTQLDDRGSDGAADGQPRGERRG